MLACVPDHQHPHVVLVHYYSTYVSLSLCVVSAHVVCSVCACFLLVHCSMCVYCHCVSPVSPPTSFVIVWTSECMALVVSVGVCSQWCCEWPFYQSVVVSWSSDVSYQELSCPILQHCYCMSHPLKTTFKVPHKRHHNVWSVRRLSP